MTTSAAQRLGGSGPLWRRLADDLRGRIARGDFLGAFPGELALVEEYGVSRHTVREALRGLRRDGLVTAARGRPSRIAPARLIEQPASSVYSLFAAVRAAGMPQRSVVRHLELCTDADVAAALEMPAETELVHLERLRLAGDSPLAIDRVWLPARIARPLLDVDFSNTALYAELRRECGVVITGGSERVTAEIPDEATRAALGIGPGIAVFHVDRLGRAGGGTDENGEAGEPVEWRETVLRGDLFSMTTQYPASAGAPPEPGAHPVQEDHVG